MDANLLNLFDSIETNSSTLIPDNDMQAIQVWWEQFMSEFNNLHALWQEFVKRDAENTNDKFVIYSLDHVSVKGSSSFGEWENTLAMYSYSFKFDIVHCEQLIKKIAGVIECQIIHHFNQTYGCNLECNNVLQISLFTGEKYSDKVRYNQSIPQLQIILDDVLRQNGGMSFEEKGNHDTKLSYGNNLKYNEISLSGKTVSVCRIAEFSEWSNHDLTYTGRSNVNKILRTVAFCFFSNEGLFHILTHGDKEYLEHMRASQALNIESKASKLEQIKYFKNQKIGIKFRKEEDAKIFYNFLMEVKAMAKVA